MPEILKPELVLPKRKLFLDMDGPLVDFEGAIAKLREDGFEGEIDEHPDIFAVAEPTPGSIEAVAIVKDWYETYILSTVPWKNPNGASQKIAWVKRHHGGDGPENPFYKRMILTHRKDLVGGPDDFLVDDRTKNGAAEFRGKLILFGSEEFPAWDAVVEYLREQHKADELSGFEMKKLIRETVAKVLIIDEKNQILVLFRSGTHPRFAHQPDLPGGIVEDGEDALTALHREIVEELNIDVPVKKFAKIYEAIRETDYPDRKYKTIDNLYLVKIREFHPDKIQLSWEHEKFAIMPLREFLTLDFPENLDGYLKGVIDFLRKTTLTK